MMGKTHLAVGVAVAIPLMYYCPEQIAIVPSTLGLVGAVAPDWDLKLGIKHRTITHSIFFPILISFITSFFSLGFSYVFLATYLSHILLDSFTIMGVPLFYPIIKDKYGLRVIKTGSATDMGICISAIYLISEMIARI